MCYPCTTKCEQSPQVVHAVCSKFELVGMNSSITESALDSVMVEQHESTLTADFVAWFPFQS